MTRSSNTMRTATEQLLISDAIDRSVQSINFQVLSGKSVYFDKDPLKEVVDSDYLISSFRQHLLANGCILKDERSQAEYIVEPRAGAVGTDNHDLLFGIPATNVPQLTMLAALPPAIPEIPIAKRRDQRGIAKISVFAYQRDTGIPIWQSGIVASESTANYIWILGAGPFKQGTIYDGTSLVNAPANPNHSDPMGQVDTNHMRSQSVRLAREAIFRQPAYEDLDQHQISNYQLEETSPSSENSQTDTRVQQAAYSAPDKK